jgi:hypothetical protein
MVFPSTWAFCFSFFFFCFYSCDYGGLVRGFVLREAKARDVSCDEQLLESHEVALLYADIVHV